MQRGAQSELEAKGTLLKDIASWLEGTDDDLENCMTGDITLLPNLTNDDLSYDNPFPGDGEIVFPVAPGLDEGETIPDLGWDNANP